MTNPQSVIEAASWILGAGSSAAIVVQLVKMALTSAIADEPRLKVITAAVTSLALVLTYAVSNGILTAPNSYTLIGAWITVTATGAGLQSAVSATLTNRPQP